MAVDWNEQAISGRQAEPTGPPESRVAVRPEMVRMGLERLKTHPPPPPPPPTLHPSPEPCARPRCPCAWS